MSFVAPELAAPVQAFATALGIGLLVGMERERRPDSAAGLRTFALVAMLGGLFLGFAEVLSIAYIGSDMRDAVAFGFLFLVLLLRPKGLFGSLQERKV